MSDAGPHLSGGPPLLNGALLYVQELPSEVRTCARGQEVTEREESIFPTQTCWLSQHGTRGAPAPITRRMDASQRPYTKYEYITYGMREEAPLK
jgi:hypothetical protein